MLGAESCGTEHATVLLVGEQIDEKKIQKRKGKRKVMERK